MKSMKLMKNLNLLKPKSMGFNMMRLPFNSLFRTQKMLFNDEVDDVIRGQRGGFHNRERREGSGNYYSNNPVNKRTRLSFNRDGMNIAFNLRRPMENFQNSGPGRREPFVILEIKEFEEEIPVNRMGEEKNQRFMILNGTSLAKILLLNPKTTVNENDLQSINVNQRFRNLTVTLQQETNKYLFELECIPREDDNRLTERIVSQVELLPEDIVLIQKFFNNCLETILNL